MEILFEFWHYFCQKYCIQLWNNLFIIILFLRSINKEKLFHHITLSLFSLFLKLLFLFPNIFQCVLHLHILVYLHFLLIFILEKFTIRFTFIEIPFMTSRRSWKFSCWTTSKSTNFRNLRFLNCYQMTLLNCNFSIVEIVQLCNQLRKRFSPKLDRVI